MGQQFQRQVTPPQTPCVLPVCFKRVSELCLTILAVPEEFRASDTGLEWGACHTRACVSIICSPADCKAFWVACTQGEKSSEWVPLVRADVWLSTDIRVNLSSNQKCYKRLIWKAFLSLLGYYPRDSYALYCLLLHLFFLEGAALILPRPQSVLEQLGCASKELPVWTSTPPCVCPQPNQSLLWPLIPGAT